MMMKNQVTIMAVVLILVALTSNLDMVAEAQLGPGDCLDGCMTGCVQPDMRKTSRCEAKCSIRCGPDAQKTGENGA